MLTNFYSLESGLLPFPSHFVEAKNTLIQEGQNQIGLYITVRVFWGKSNVGLVIPKLPKKDLLLFSVERTLDTFLKLMPAKISDYRWKENFVTNQN